MGGTRGSFAGGKAAGALSSANDDASETSEKITEGQNEVESVRGWLPVT